MFGELKGNTIAKTVNYRHLVSVNKYSLHLLFLYKNTELYRRRAIALSAMSPELDMKKYIGMNKNDSLISSDSWVK